MRNVKHIIVRTYGDKQTIWVSQPYLLEKTELREVYLRKMRHQYRRSLVESHRAMEIAPASGKAWRFVEMEGLYYYDYAYVPNHQPKCYQDKLGTRAELLAKRWKPYDDETADRVLTEKIERLLIEKYEGDIAAAAMYHLKQYRDEGTARQYAEAWAWSRMMLDVNSTRYFVELGLSTGKEWFEACARVLKKKQLAGMKVGSGVAIQNKLRAFAKLADSEAQWSFFIHKNEGNQHHAKMSSEVRKILIYLRGLGLNFSDRQIVRKMDEISKRYSLEIPSERSIRSFLASRPVRAVTEQGRFGRKGRYRSMMQGYLPIAKPLFAGDCWQIDATRINMIAHTKSRMVDNKVVKKDEHLFFCAAMDVYSGALLGWSYGVTESHRMYHQAMMMAVENTGYLPYELVHDAFPGHNKEEWMSVDARLRAYGVKTKKVSDAQGKAQLERAFGTLQSIFMADTPWYYGEGIRSKRRYAHRSEEYLVKAGKMGTILVWDEEKKQRTMDGIIERYNATPLINYSTKAIKESPQELHDSSERLNVIRPASWQVAKLFYLCKRLKVRRGGLLTTRIQDQELNYMIDDYATIKQQEEVDMYYDLRDLSKVQLFDGDKYLCEARELVPLQVYGTQADRGRLSHERALLAAKGQLAEAEYSEVKEQVESQFGSIGMLGEELLLLPHSTQKDKAEQVESMLLATVHETADEEVHEVRELTEQELADEMRRTMQGG